MWNLWGSVGLLSLMISSIWVKPKPFVQMRRLSRCISLKARYFLVYLLSRNKCKKLTVPSERPSWRLDQLFLSSSLLTDVQITLGAQPSELMQTHTTSCKLAVCPAFKLWWCLVFVHLVSHLSVYRLTLPLCPSDVTGSAGADIQLTSGKDREYNLDRLLVHHRGNSKSPINLEMFWDCGRKTSVPREMSMY